MPDRDTIVAVGLLTARDLSVLGQDFKRAFLIQGHHEFEKLLRRINEAEHAAR